MNDETTTGDAEYLATVGVSTQDVSSIIISVHLEDQGRFRVLQDEVLSHQLYSICAMCCIRNVEVCF